MVETQEQLRKAIEREWAWRGKYLAPSGVDKDGTLWVIDLETSAGLRVQIESGELSLGRHTTKGLQYGWADIHTKVKVLTSKRSGAERR